METLIVNATNNCKDIRITFPCELYPLTHLFYIVKLDLQGYFLLIFALKHRLWVLVKTASPNLCFEQNYKYIMFLHLKIIILNPCILHRHVCFMIIENAMSVFM